MSLFPIPSFNFSSSILGCQCTEPNQVCVDGRCVCDTGFTSDRNGNCQPDAGR